MGKLQDQKSADYRKTFAYAAAFSQIVLIILYSSLTEYGPGPSANSIANSDVDTYYPFYQDVHKYGFSSVGYNFLISCFAIQWAMICNGLLHVIATAGTDAYHEWETLQLGIVDLIKGDFAAGAVLISFGAVLGKTTPLQMLLVVFFELIFYAINESIGAGRLVAVDMGGSIFVHTFGAYFGLGMSWVISRTKWNKGTNSADSHPKNGSNKTSDMFAMIGTLFLWMFWPSFNGALATEDQQYRVVINTVIALSASCIAAFLTIQLLNHENKFDMVSIQNATLAGGVAVGSSSDLVIQPWGALVVGLVAGFVSVVGYEKIQPFLARCMGLDDTCGVHNLHGLPGIIGALGGAISAAAATDTAYGTTIGAVFPARAPSNATEAALLGVAAGEDRSASDQAAIQVAALAITLGISIFGGMVTGFIIKMPCLLPPLGNNAKWCEIGRSSDSNYWYEDKEYWVVEGEEDEEEEEAARQLEEDKLRAELDLEIQALTAQRAALGANAAAGADAAGAEKESATPAAAGDVEMTDQ